MLFEIYFCTSSTFQLLFILLNISLKKREYNVVLYLVNVEQKHTSPNEQGRTDNFLDVKSLKKKLLHGSYLPVFATDTPMTTPRLFREYCFISYSSICQDRSYHSKHVDNIIVCNETVC